MLRTFNPLYMMREIVGTVFTVLFDIFFVLFVIWLFQSINPLWAAFFTAIFGCAAVYATVAVSRYWFYRIKWWLGNKNK